MAWKKHLLVLLTSLALVALVAHPSAVAQVERFTDSRGVIHITNVTGPEPAAAPDLPATADLSPEPPEVDETNADALVLLTLDTNPKDKQDKLRLFYEIRSEAGAAPPGAEEPTED